MAKSFSRFSRMIRSSVGSRFWIPKPATFAEFQYATMAIWSPRRGTRRTRSLQMGSPFAVPSGASALNPGTSKASPQTNVSLPANRRDGGRVAHYNPNRKRSRECGIYFECASVGPDSIAPNHEFKYNGASQPRPAAPVDIRRHLTLASLGSQRIIYRPPWSKLLSASGGSSDFPDPASRTENHRPFRRLPALSLFPGQTVAHDAK